MAKRTVLAAMSGLIWLGACAVAPGDLPDVHYASAVSEGGVPTFLAGRPSRDQVAIAEDKWSRAVSDSFHCGIKQNAVFEAGMVGALELSVMTSLAQNGGKRERNKALSAYAAKVMSLAFSGGDRPSARRCEDLKGWVPKVRADGKAALKRADERGELDGIKLKL